VLWSSLSNKLKLVSGQGDYVSGQLRQGVSISLGVRIGRLDVRTAEAGSSVFLGVRTSH
jgi:hypothetical protein